MKIRVSSDSGPYAIYTEAKGWDGDIVEVPDSVFERYDRADDEFRAAEEALEIAIEAARRSAKDSRTA